MSSLVRDDAWRYILEVYARSGVAEDLLRQQQETGLDIVLHLFFLYVKDRLGGTVGDQARLDAEALVRPWRETVIGPLRELRRTMKNFSGPAGTFDAKESLRQSIKQAELQAEQTEFYALCEWFDGWQRGSESQRPESIPPQRQ